MNIFQPHNLKEFNELALQSFAHQYNHVEVYRKFVQYLGINPGEVSDYDKIVFLPVELFKSHKIFDVRANPKLVFTSSGTTGMKVSRHYVSEPELYKKSFTKGFINFYGNPSEYCILALLPSYLERDSSSLIFMVKDLILLSGHKDSGFYLNNYEELSEKLKALKTKNTKVLLLGVSFALLDLSEKFPQDLSPVIIMETGGMKGRKKEVTREELHETLCKAFNVNEIHSEYGMTELLSQAYSKGNGIYFPPPWMKIIIKDPHDPFETLAPGKSGRINIIDLANRDSCCFIATSDLGKVYEDGSFEVLGRMDNSDLRGCNLMIG